MSRPGRCTSRVNKQRTWPCCGVLEELSRGGAPSSQQCGISMPRMRIIVLDLSGLEMLDAGALGMFVFLHCWTRVDGIQLKLVTPCNYA